MKANNINIFHTSSTEFLLIFINESNSLKVPNTKKIINLANQNRPYKTCANGPTNRIISIEIKSHL